MAYAKARKRKYSNATKLKNAALKSARHYMRLAYFDARRYTKRHDAMNRSLLYHAKKAHQS